MKGSEIAEKAENAKNAKNAKIFMIAKTAKIAEIAEIAKIAEIELLRFLETFKVWIFFEKIDGLSKKSLLLFKNAKSGKFAVECVSNGFVPQKCLPP